MKCFECGSDCLTLYGINHPYKFENELPMTRWVVSPGTSKINYVRKDCQQCGWVSFPTKVPGAIE